MATITPYVVLGNNDYTGKAALSASLSTGDVIPIAGNGLLLHLRNVSTGGGAVTVTITSATDPFGRTKDASIVLGITASTSSTAPDSYIAGPYLRAGWASTVGQLRVTSTGAGLVKLTAITL